MVQLTGLSRHSPCLLCAAGLGLTPRSQVQNGQRLPTGGGGSVSAASGVFLPAVPSHRSGPAGACGAVSVQPVWKLPMERQGLNCCVQQRSSSLGSRGAAGGVGARVPFTGRCQQLAPEPGALPAAGPVPGMASRALAVPSLIGLSPGSPSSLPSALPF